MVRGFSRVLHVHTLQYVKYPPMLYVHPHPNDPILRATNGRVKFWAPNPLEIGTLNVHCISWLLTIVPTMPPQKVHTKIGRQHWNSRPKPCQLLLIYVHFFDNYFFAVIVRRFGLLALLLKLKLKLLKVLPSQLVLHKSSLKRLPTGFIKSPQKVISENLLPHFPILYIKQEDLWNSSLQY